MWDGAEATKKKKSKSKRRFSDEQIRALEVMFQSETKLEPNKKVQLATELGLHPRQVAIWWKSKHVQKEYTILLSHYNTLCFNFQALNKQNQSLLTQSRTKSDTCKMDYEVRSKYLDEELKIAAADTSEWRSLDSDDMSFQWWDFWS